MIRYILFSFLILILGCDAKPLIPLSNKDTTSIIVNNFHVKKLPFPKDGYIIIDAEKTIYDIANNYNLLPQDIIEANNLKYPYTLSPNDRVLLPYPKMHLVKKSQNIYQISLIYAVSQSDIVELNNLRKPYKLKQGYKIKIPLEKDYSVIGLINKSKIIKKLEVINNTKIRSKFIIPVDGKIVKNFGPFDNGKQHNDGINLKVTKDQFIKASMSGKVAFVGSNLKSFGKMILIKHDRKYVTAYARINDFTVAEGDIVKQGQVIGKILKNNYLHFQIRKSRNPVNPAIYIN